MPFGPGAPKVLEARYVKIDPHSGARETPEEMLDRVARWVAEGESHFDGASAAGRWRQAFLDALARLDFLPNWPK